MVDHTAPIKIRRIPIDRVIVENPRERSEKTFKQLVAAFLAANDQ